MINPGLSREGLNEEEEILTVLRRTLTKASFPIWSVAASRSLSQPREF